MHYEQEEIDYETGEVKRKIIKGRPNSEPPYIKLYLKTLCLMKKVPQGNNSILYSLLSGISYASPQESHGGQIIVINKYVRQAICEELGIAEITLKKALTAFVDNGLFKRVARGTYQANPEFFGKGDWRDISNIIATINFKTGTISPKFQN